MKISFNENINLQTTVVHRSFLNSKIKSQHQKITRIFNASLLDSVKNRNKWFSY